MQLDDDIQVTLNCYPAAESFLWLNFLHLCRTQQKESDETLLLRKYHNSTRCLRTEWRRKFPIHFWPFHILFAIKLIKLACRKLFSTESYSTFVWGTYDVCVPYHFVYFQIIFLQLFSIEFHSYDFLFIINFHTQFVLWQLFWCFYGLQQ